MQGSGPFVQLLRGLCPHCRDCSGVGGVAAVGAEPAEGADTFLKTGPYACPTCSYFERRCAGFFFLVRRLSLAILLFAIKRSQSMFRDATLFCLCQDPITWTS